MRVLLHFRPWLEAFTPAFEASLDGLERAYARQFACGPASEGAARSAVLLGLGDLDAQEIGELALPPDQSAILSTAELPTDADAERFRQAVEAVAPGRTVRFLSQSARFPYSLSEGLSSGEGRWIAAVGERELPSWPTLGVSIPTIDNSTSVAEAVHSFLAVYPGEIRFAIVANGTTGAHLEGLERLSSEFPESVEVLRQPENLGYGQGANVGLARLQQRGDIDVFAVSNDDVVPGLDCLCELVSAWAELSSLGYRPGLLGPVSNRINGSQQVEIGEYGNVEQLWSRSIEWQATKRSSAAQAVQIRGLLLLIDPECLEAVGGFDPRFGIGNFEDDDLNLRARLAGFSLWIAEGAFLHHHGSATFTQLGIDYEANIRRNCETFLEKWRIERIEEWPSITAAPEGVDLRIPLSVGAEFRPHFPITIHGERVDLVTQASDIEFAAWVMAALRDRPRTERREVIALLDGKAA